MNDAAVDLHAYLAPPRLSFWMWHDADQTLAWAQGQTIAFRPELELVLRSLAGEGLPPLSLVALVLAACRQSWFHALTDPENVLMLSAHLGELDT